uniref:ADF-H domain-containing protein n=1 Tax=Salix viminalis TaxID=40686 RepID=A0A6N2MHN8_SALVM
MEEERARQEAAAKRAADEAARQGKGEEPPSNSQDTAMVDKDAEATNSAADPMDEVNALLQQAIALSMENAASDPSVRDSEMAEATNDDQDLAMALQMSIQESAKDSSSQSDMSKALEDQSFVSSVLASLPGVDPNDPSVKELLASFQGQASQSESGQKKDEDKPPSDDKLNIGRATTGMWVTDECKNSFHQMKWKKVLRYIVFKIDEKSGGHRDRLVAPARATMILLLPYRVMTADMLCLISILSLLIIAGRARSSSLHAASRIRAKMLYATSKAGLSRVLEGIHYELQATDPTEMGFDLIRDRAK